ncbi:MULTISPECIES: SDR family oxidoreductase [Stenotrophomonas maltophilia group]|uniref:SDR family oxidoreductase n=1 Tax=Stenotrophomonas maltophilia group TaxID=995085 RepID=UPI000F675995|nr:SDR family oxidoreductase [Stenotrophomonas maltophilia]RRU71455.1 SDR family NAD(P)-dependent oxidoreductase [Stenotrophomonas maltophilia]
MFIVPDQKNRLIVVTGASSGTGEEAARRLAASHADIIMAVRNEEKGNAVCGRIRGQYPSSSIAVRHLDLSSLASVHEFAGAILSDGRPVDVLINNAGIMMPPRRMLSADGFELQMATNFLGHFALTNLLMPALLAAKAPRVSTVTSSAAIGAKINLSDLQSSSSYQPMAAYAQSKLACLVFANTLAEIADERGWPLLSTSSHPGHTRTNLQTSGPNIDTGSTRKKLAFKLVPSMDVKWATESILRAAVDPTATQGAFYGPRFLLVGDSHLARQPRSAMAVDRAQLWQLAEELTRTSLPSDR